jgi:hypothetical protein
MHKQSPIIPVRFQMDNMACHLLETMAFAGTTGSSFNNVGNPVAQLDFFDEEQKVSSYKVV